MMAKEDSMGLWVSLDQGVSWSLESPSEEFTATQQSPIESANDLDNIINLLAAFSPEQRDQLQRVLTLGIAITEPAAVDALVASVDNGDPVSGLAVVAEAALAAQTPTDI